MGCFESKPEPGHSEVAQAPKSVGADGHAPAPAVVGEAAKSTDPKDKNKELAMKAFGFAKKAYEKKKSGHGGGHGGGGHGQGGHGGHEEGHAEEEVEEAEDE
jgi:hypothetical protein